MEKEIIFVIHNIGKIKSAERHFENLKFKTFNRYNRNTGNFKINGK